MQLSLWLLFSTLIWLAERGEAGSSLDSRGAALYWGVAAFSTAGTADTPLTGMARLLGGLWIVVGSMTWAREEIELLKETVDALVGHVEKLKTPR